MFHRILNRSRARSLARKLAARPSIENYVALAHSHANGGSLEEVFRVCKEGLGLHPGNAELLRLKTRSETLAREDRVRDLQRQLSSAPRPALYKELCEIHLKTGRLSRAEKLAEQWESTTNDPEAFLQQALIRSARFLADRRRDDARVALDFADRFLAECPNGAAAIRLKLDIYSRCGAWQDARRALARLLELQPGDPALEARFRTVASLAEKAPTLDRALRDVERTGSFVDDDADFGRTDSALAIRPLLQTIAARKGVLAAFYVQGGTALVQGPRGASAERYARGVREIVSLTRGASRRMGLGRPVDIQVEGPFGSLAIRSGSLGAGAVWSDTNPTVRTTDALAMLVGEEGRGRGADA